MKEEKEQTKREREKRERGGRGSDGAISSDLETDPLLRFMRFQGLKRALERPCIQSKLRGKIRRATALTKGYQYCYIGKKGNNLP